MCWAIWLTPRAAEDLAQQVAARAGRRRRLRGVGIVEGRLMGRVGQMADDLAEAFAALNVVLQTLRQGRRESVDRGIGLLGRNTELRSNAAHGVAAMRGLDESGKIHFILFSKSWADRNKRAPVSHAKIAQGAPICERMRRHIRIKTARSRFSDKGLA